VVGVAGGDDPCREWNLLGSGPVRIAGTVGPLVGGTDDRCDRGERREELEELVAHHRVPADLLPLRLVERPWLRQHASVDGELADVVQLRRPPHQCPFGNAEPEPPRHRLGQAPDLFRVPAQPVVMRSHQHQQDLADPAAHRRALEQLLGDPRLRLPFGFPALERLFDPKFESEGCYLIPREAAEAHIPNTGGIYRSTRNGGGRWAWQHHWLAVPLQGRDGSCLGVVFADDPVGPAAPDARAPAGASPFRRPGDGGARVGRPVRTWPGEASRPHLGASFGIAVWRGNGEANVEELLRRADEAMYEAKRTRSRLRIAA
jgi:Diguanylate cyclase, GGDEF domain